MKKVTLFLIGILILFVFHSCENHENNLSLKEKLMQYKEWNAVKFVVNNENTMHPDNSDILDKPVSYVKIRFVDESNIILEIEIKEKNRIDNSGELKISYIINDKDHTINMTDNNLWTKSASFTGKHIINLENNNLTLSGKMGSDFDYIMLLKGK